MPPLMERVTYVYTHQNTYGQVICPLFSLLTCFQCFVGSRGEPGVQVSFFAVFSHSERKLWVRKSSLLFFYLRLPLHKGITTRDGALHRTSGGRTALLILDTTKRKDTIETEDFNENGRKMKRNLRCYLWTVCCLWMFGLGL